MILINPFKGLRPKSKLASKISTPGIGYLSKKVIRKQKTKYNKGFLNILLSKNPKKANRQLLTMKKSSLIKDDKNSYYIYRITSNSHSQIGIIGKINLSKYDDKNILGHEETFEKRVIERKKQMSSLNTQIGPIYTVHEGNKKLNKLINQIIKSKKNYSFSSVDKCKHDLWIVNNKERIENIRNMLKKIGKLYVCDGHHRIQAMLRINKIKSAMIVAFPKNHIKILYYNRLVKSKMKKEKIFKIINKNFLIKKVKFNYKPNKIGKFGMYINKSWYSLKFKKKLNKLNIKNLDINILHNYIINNLIKNTKTTNNIKYVSGIYHKKLLEKKVNSKNYSLALTLFPTKINDVINIAEKKKIMPPKSTWFHPKPLDGLISFEL